MTAENDFLEEYSAESFPRPSLAVDVALVTIINKQLHVLMIRRVEHPDQDHWQLPGTFVHLAETLEAAAARALAEKTVAGPVFTEQLYTFGRLDRDPRTRVVSVAYYALVDPARIRDPIEGQLLGAIAVPWQGETGGPVQILDQSGPLEVAFDHAEIVGTVVKRLRGKLNYAPVGYELLPRRFTLLELQTVHETIMGEPINKDSFRRRMLASGELVPTGEKQRGVGHRPASLYRMAPSRP